VIEPLAGDRDINCVFALEYYDGEQFSRAWHAPLARDTKHTSSGG
jgi:hypothetical protein